MKTIKGPALFLGQFAGDAAPFNSWDAITRWAADCGYVGVQVPTWAGQLIDLKKAASCQDYCDEFKGVAEANGVEVTELSTHLQGQLVAVHPAYDELFDGFAAPEVRGNPKARQAMGGRAGEDGADGVAAHGARRAMATFSGALAWPFVYPWPQRPAGLIETAFDELARRWRPLLDHAEENGVDICYEIHPGEDLFDGTTFEMFLDRVDGHAALQHALRPVALRAAVPRLSRQHRHLPRADPDVPRQGRRVQPDRPAGRLFRLSPAGSTAPAASARPATGRSTSARSSRSSPPTTSPAGRWSSGNAR